VTQVQKITVKALTHAKQKRLEIDAFGLRHAKLGIGIKNSAIGFSKSGRIANGCGLAYGIFSLFGLIAILISAVPRPMLIT